MSRALKARVHDLPPVFWGTRHPDWYERGERAWIRFAPDRWLDRGFTRRCDASRWARAHGYTVEHWHAI